MSWLLIVGIALANNLDNVGVGMAYGATGRRIRPLANLWIALIGFVVTDAAGLAGWRMETWLTPFALRLLSATLLCGIGVWFLLQSAHRSQTAAGAASDGPAQGVESKKEEGKEDRQDKQDKEGKPGQTGEVGFGPATLLGAGLAVNNIGGGFSAGLAHQSAWWTALLSAVFSYAAIGIGGQSRHLLGLGWVERHANSLAGALLVLIGLKQLF